MGNKYEKVNNQVGEVYPQHQEYRHGDMSFMDKYLPGRMVAIHIDSYNNEFSGTRFQGSFHHPKFGLQDDAPLELLKLAESYKVSKCGCQSDGPARDVHLIWTIRFKKPGIYVDKDFNEIIVTDGKD